MPPKNGIENLTEPQAEATAAGGPDEPKKSKSAKRRERRKQMLENKIASLNVAASGGGADKSTGETKATVPNVAESAESLTEPKAGVVSRGVSVPETKAAPPPKPVENLTEPQAEATAGRGSDEPKKSKTARQRQRKKGKQETAPNTISNGGGSHKETDGEQNAVSNVTRTKTTPPKKTVAPNAMEAAENSPKSQAEATAGGGSNEAKKSKSARRRQRQREMRKQKASLDVMANEGGASKAPGGEQSVVPNVARTKTAPPQKTNAAETAENSTEPQAEHATAGGGSSEAKKSKSARRRQRQREMKKQKASLDVIVNGGDVKAAGGEKNDIVPNVPATKTVPQESASAKTVTEGTRGQANGDAIQGTVGSKQTSAAMASQEKESSSESATEKRNGTVAPVQSAGKGDFEENRVPSKKQGNSSAPPKTPAEQKATRQNTETAPPAAAKSGTPSMAPTEHVESTPTSTTQPSEGLKLTQTETKMESTPTPDAHPSNAAKSKQTASEGTAREAEAISAPEVKDKSPSVAESELGEEQKSSVLVESAPSVADSATVADRIAMYEDDDKKSGDRCECNACIIS